MKEITNTVKDNISTILGFFVMLFSFGCYFFNWPQERNEIVNSIEFCAGIVLVFMPMEKIASDIWEILKSKLNGNKSKA
jgi:hypothetical protein